ncbi:MAG: SDR family NAD(P)-dependent oxidoreductase [Verrucomicrobia bacterium]|nr:SDR family NAD(P)-dependent oxidoreductase [Verrucomicrobiota bacterium]
MHFTHRFTSADQHAFALLSGDWNPMHMDAASARRTVFGERVVHGVHSLLWALSVAAPRGALAHLDVKFQKGVLLGSELHCTMKGTPEAFNIVVSIDGAPAVKIKGRTGSFARSCAPRSAPEHDRQAAVVKYADASGMRGTATLGCDDNLLGKLLPGLSLPTWQTEVLLATTRVVGMQCPGLHSIYAGLTMDFDEPIESNLLSYAVQTEDSPYSSVEIMFDGAGAHGKARALFRPPPQAQATYADAALSVTPSEFQSWRALVVGGSRGLGEVAAKLITAGGGSVCLTYAIGADDARKICDELQSAGREAHAVRLDVTQTELPMLPWQPTHLLYFATPQIPTDRAENFSMTHFTRLCDYYVEGFHRLVTSLPSLNAILYPSTIYLDEHKPQLAAYCAAKAAGEVLCRHLAGSRRIHMPRLPRLATDQTTGITSNSAPAALPVILRELRTLGALKP